jgi:hypothetical protein
LLFGGGLLLTLFLIGLMAENTNIIITVTADDSGAITKINKLGNEINTAGAASKSWIKQLGELKTQLAALDPKSAEWAALAMEYKELGGSAKVVSQSFEELTAQAGSVGNSIPTEPVKNFRQQIKELTNALQTSNLDKTSDEYRALQKRLEAAKDAQKDFNENIGANAGPAFESAGNNVRNLTSRLSSLDFDGASDAVNGLTKNVKGLNFSGATEGSSAFGKSIVGLGKALLTNPIFLIGAVLALLITNFDKLANVVPALSIAFEAIGAVVGFVKDAITGFTDAIGLTSVAAADAVDGAIGNLEEKQKKLDNARRLAVANAQKTGEDVGAVNENYRKKEIANNQDLINKVNALEKRGVKLTEEQLAARKKAIDANTEFAIKAAEDESSAVIKARDEAAKAEEKAQADKEQAAQVAAQKAQARRDAIKAKEAEVTDALKQAREAQFQNTLDAEGKELRQVELKYEQLEEKAGTNATLLKQLKEQELTDLQAITDRYSQEELTATQAAEAKKAEDAAAAAAKANEERIKLEDQQFALSEEIRINSLSANESRKQKELQDLATEYDAKLLIARGNATLTAQLTTERNAEIERINKEFRDAEKTADEKTQADKLAAFTATSELVTKSAQDGISTLLSLNDAFAGKSERSQKKAFERNKLLQIAQTSVNTYQSAQSAYASQVIPGDPTSVIRGALAAASAVAAGLANIAKIKATTFTSPAPSGGNNSTGGGGGDLAAQGVASSEVPQFNPLANLGLENQPGQIQPAYVLASDIASSMEARSKVEDLSRL